MGCAVLQAPAVLSQAVIMIGAARCARCAGQIVAGARGGQSMADKPLIAADLQPPKEGYKRVHMLEVAKANTLDRAVAVIVCGKVHLTPKGERELQALKEQYGSKPCEHCRFWDGRCVLGEPEVCR